MAKKPASTSSPLSAGTRIAVLHGPEVFLRQLRTQQLRDALVAANGEIQTFYFDGQTARPADVLDECRSFGLMATHKLVIVDNADQFVKDTSRPLVERYAESPTDSATLLLRGDKWNKGKLDAMIEKVGAVIDCQPLPPGAAVSWAVDRCAKRHDATIAREAAELLVERLGSDLGRIDTELEKLATAAGKGAAITPALVAEFVGRSREDEVWGIQSTLLGGNAGKILSHLRDVVEVSRQPTVLVSFAYMELARKLHGAAAGVRAGANPFSLRGPLKLWGAMAEAVPAAARTIAPGDAAKLYAQCVESDARQKTGQSDPGRALEVTGVRYAMLKRRGGTGGGTGGGAGGGEVGNASPRA